MWRHRHDAGDAHTGPPLAPWARTYLRVQGAVASVVALALLLAPGAMVDVWPWPITTLLAQLYAAPLLAYGVGSVILSRQRSWRDVRVGAVTMLVFAGGVLVASALHLDLFSAEDVSAWLWFAGFTLAVAGLAPVTARSVGTGAEGVAS